MASRSRSGIKISRWKSTSTAAVSVSKNQVNAPSISSTRKTTVNAPVQIKAKQRIAAPTGSGTTKPAGVPAQTRAKTADMDYILMRVPVRK